MPLETATACKNILLWASADLFASGRQSGRLVVGKNVVYIRSKAQSQLEICTSWVLGVQGPCLAASRCFALIRAGSVGPWKSLERRSPSFYLEPSSTSGPTPAWIKSQPTSPPTSLLHFQPININSFYSDTRSSKSLPFSTCISFSLPEISQPILHSRVPFCDTPHHTSTLRKYITYSSLHILT